MKKIETELTSREIGQLFVYYIAGSRKSIINKQEKKMHRNILEFVDRLESTEKLKRYY